jgi:large subunit ribosomal protein L6
MRTSRIGRRPVAIPAGVDVKFSNDQLTVKGPKGQMSVDVHPYVDLLLDKEHINVTPKVQNKLVITGSKVKLYRSIVGTMRAAIANLIYGVTHGFERKLNLVGVGYRAQAKGKTISLSLGYSHPTDYTLPDGITAETPTQTEIVIKGVDKRLVGEVAAQIRSIRKADEQITNKETKKK